ncbi:MAG: type II toxin-antitoxin system RelE/ParE family toxin [Rhodospirillales bacterium]|nr:type II toxin-antitoxin system RelE/ParE family toxin [Rhodospirillales bacterium]
MDAYKTKVFARWADKENLGDAALCQALQETNDGLVDANLGGGLIKKRIAAPGRGKSGSYRTLIAFCSGERAVFLYGFGKNERDNIDEKEKKALKLLAGQFLDYKNAELNAAIQKGVLTKVTCDDKEKA